MIKHLLLSGLVASFFVTPVMARSNKQDSDMKRTHKEKIENLTQEQKAALNKFKTTMKEERQKNKKEREVKKEQYKSHKAEVKAAFIEGDFKKIESLKNKNKQVRQQSMEQYQEAKRKAMEDSFGNLSKEDREALADIVLKKKPRKGTYAKRGKKDSKE